MSFRFLTEGLKDDIYKNVLEKMLPDLERSQKKVLFGYLIGLVQYIAMCFDFDDPEVVRQFYIKLTQNSYKDTKWLLLQLLPYINENTNKIHDIQNLSDIYTKKKIDVNINEISPSYVYSNFQYGRFVEKDGNYNEVQFNFEYIKHNYYLLLDTIKRCRYKLHVNWVDIVPFRLDTFEETCLYRHTQIKFANNSLVDWDPLDDYPIDMVNDYTTLKNLKEKIMGLGIDDIYNSISIDLYDKIVDQKWMLFDVGIEINDAIKIVPVITCLSTIIGNNVMGSIARDINWMMLDSKKCNEFVEQWKKIVVVFKDKIELGAGGETGFRLQFEAIDIIDRAIVIFFGNKFTKINEVLNDKIHEYRQIGKANEDVDEDELVKKKFSHMDVLSSLESIRPMYIYEFLRESVNRFKSTFYGSVLMEDNKLLFRSLNDENVCGFRLNNESVNYITCKNIYNYCKSLVHKQVKNDFVRYPTYWSEIDDTIKGDILNRLNNKIPNNKILSKWFNIKGNLRHVHKTFGILFTEADIDLKNDIIYTGIREYLIQIIFRLLITNGVLTSIIPSNDLTDSTKFDITDKIQKNALVAELGKQRFYNNNGYANNSYYYLTNRPFGETGKFNIKIDDDGKPKLCEYFDFVRNPKFAWYLNTAYHWVAQIGFCHRFVNTRVTYITGGTGAGKSTQIPKLFCYYIKAIEHKENPTVIVTVPRTDPVTSVSAFVSKEMGVPYTQFNIETEKEEHSENYYVQMKHMKERDSFVKEGYFPKVRFITDGSIVREGKDSLFKKKLLKNGVYLYNKESVCDVVIVDEAHEHNAYMDVILSMFRTGTYYNNQLRFVIMSATMDSDEPTYRRFYRIINDNRKYPLNFWIKKHNIDRINVDRRYDIQPPGQTARFKVVEHYRPEMKPEDMVREIIYKYPVGDVLLFQPGSGDITKSVSILNAKGFLPDDVIAVPYYATMREISENNTKIAQGIDKQLGKIKIGKTERFESSDLSKGTHSYKRAVLVATNIAEASITIDSLKIVVDTGIEKTMIFDYERKGGVLIQTSITEASRRQRRGRVGRTGEGYAYFLYDKGKMENNVKQYNIATEDIRFTIMYDFLRDPNDDPLFTDIFESIVTGINMPTVPMTQDDFCLLVWESYLLRKFKGKISHDIIHDISAAIVRDKEQFTSNKNILRNISNILNSAFNIVVVGKNNMDNINNIVDIVKYIEKYSDCIETIIKIFKEQYFVAGEFYNYYGNEAMYNYKINMHMFPTYQSGYDIEQLVDADGTFYIVHPDELVIRRNIGGNVVGVVNINETDNRQHVILEPAEGNRKKMVSRKIMVFWEMLMNQMFVKFVDINKQNKILKTEIGMFIYGIMTELDDNNLAQILGTCFALLNPETNDNDKMHLNNILSTIAMLKAINGDISLLGDINRLKATFCNAQSSDIDLVINIAKFIDSVINNSGYINSDFFESRYMKMNIFENIDVRNIKNSVQKYGNDLEGDIEARSKIMHAMMLKYADEVSDVIKKNIVVLSKAGLKMDFINECVDKYIKNRETYRMKYNDIVTGITMQHKRNWVDIKLVRELMAPFRRYMNNIMVDPIHGSIILSLPYNICRKIENTEHYFMPVLYPHEDSVFRIATYPFYTTSVVTVLSREKLYGYILYLSSDLSSQTIRTCIWLKPEHIGLVINTINKKSIFKAIAKIRGRFIKSGVKNVTNPIFSHDYEHSSIGSTMDVVSRDLNPFFDKGEIWKVITDVNPKYAEYKRSVS